MLEQGHLLSKTSVDSRVDLGLRWSPAAAVAEAKTKAVKKAGIFEMSKKRSSFFSFVFFAHRFFSQKQNANKNHGSLMPFGAFLPTKFPGRSQVQDANKG